MDGEIGGRCGHFLADIGHDCGHGSGIRWVRWRVGAQKYRAKLAVFFANVASGHTSTNCRRAPVYGGGHQLSQPSRTCDSLFSFCALEIIATCGFAFWHGVVTSLGTPPGGDAFCGLGVFRHGSFLGFGCHVILQLRLHQASEVHHIYSITRRYDSTDPGEATLYIVLDSGAARGDRYLGGSTLYISLNNR